MTGRPGIGAVAIGRNEGARLVACLETLADQVDRIVYVDSGSVDDSVAEARRRGIAVVELPADVPFTAARARNAGVQALLASDPAIDLIQFIDGDCTIAPGWIEAATRFLDTTPDAAVACGRRRERYPDVSIYNRLCDREWNTPIGQTKACGGDALMRRAAFEEVGGFREALIAGEEPELCLRLRGLGWTIWRLDAEMTMHDASITRFAQWWHRSRRGGFAAAEGFALHGRGPDRHGVAQTRRALVWGLAIPIASMLGAIVTPWSLILLGAYPTQIVRLALLKGADRGAWEEAVFQTLGKFPEALGFVSYVYSTICSNKNSKLIEYK